MKKTLVATAAGLALLACGGMPTAAPPAAQSENVAPRERLITSLERACLANPLDAAAWEALAAALEADGQRERARTMGAQAATLRAHDVRRDYALLRERALAASGGAVDNDMSSAMPRTQVRRIGAAMVEVTRVAPAAPPSAAPRSAPMAAGTPAGGTPTDAPPVPAAPPMPALVRLEISNGNGVTGAAARLARALDGEGWKSVRLTNVGRFDVARSRIEYRRGQLSMAESLSDRLGLPLTAQSDPSARADMRIVLGHDAASGGRFK